MVEAGRWRAALLIVAFLVAGCAGRAPEQDAIAGRARVIDGDTLEIRGRDLRLVGIDAPELRQTCTRRGRTWPCGRAAARALARKVEGRAVACTWREADRWGRPIATCRVGETDLAGWLVERGWALAFRRYTTAYATQENRARAAGRGVWAGTFTPPWDHRAGLG